MSRRRHLIPVRIGAAWMALDAVQVQEILGERRFVPVPGAPPELPGVIAWRGHAVAVVDLGGLVPELAPLGAEPRPRTLVARHDERTVALPVDAVREVHELPEDALSALHATQHPFARWEVEVEGNAMPVVELTELVDALARADGRGA